MQISAVWTSLAVVIITLGCGVNEGKDDEAELRNTETTPHASVVPSDTDNGVADSNVLADVQGDQAQEIAQRNEAMLARLREEELARMTEELPPDGTDAQGGGSFADDRSPDRLVPG